VSTKESKSENCNRYVSPSKGTVRRSLAFSFVERYLSIVMQFGASIIIARLLTPEEIGIYSVGAVIVGLAHVLRDFGVTNYLIQEKDLTATKIRAAFTATLIIAWGVAGLLFLSGPWLAEYYEEPGMQQVVSVLAVNFLLIPFGSPVLALLRRNLRFDRLLWINVGSAFAHSATSVSLAVLGIGFMSLAWGGLAGVVATTVLATLNRPKGMPLLPSVRGIRKVLQFGGTASAATLLSEAGLSAADLVVGKMLGFASVGYYSRGWGLVSLFNYAIGAAVSPVMHSSLAETHRSGRALAEEYLRALTYITPLAWTFYGFAGFMAYPLLHLLYGSQWDVAAPIVQVLCLAFALRALTFFSGQAFLARGDVRNMLLMQVILQPLRIGMTVLAATVSIVAVAWVQVIFYAATLAVTHWLLHSKIELSWRKFIHGLIPSGIISAVALIPTVLVVVAMGETDAGLGGLGISVVATGATFVLALRFAGHPLGRELRAVGHRVFMPLSRYLFTRS